MIAAQGKWILSERRITEENFIAPLTLFKLLREIAILSGDRKAELHGIALLREVRPGAFVNVYDSIS